MRASVGSTEASKSLPARVGVVGLRCPGPAELEHRRPAAAVAGLAGEDKREGFDAASSKLATSLRPSSINLQEMADLIAFLRAGG